MIQEVNENLKKFLADIKSADDLAVLKQYPLYKAPGMVSTIDQEYLHEIFQKILTDENIIRQLNNLKPGGSPLRVAREIDPITGKKANGFMWRVTRNLNGDYIHAISLKHKRLNSTKRKTENDRGAWKHRKIVLVIEGTTPRIYVELIQPFMTKNQVEELEIDIMRNNPYLSDAEVKQEIKNTFDRISERHLDEIELQQKFTKIPGFSSLLYAGTENKSVTYGSQTIQIPQTVTLAPFRYSFANYIKGLWVPTGYTIEEHEKNMDSQISKLTLEMIDAVSEMHNRHKVHRDIKPENFLLDMNRTTGKLSLEINDFDTVGNFGEEDTQIGTPEYNSPLQIQLELQNRWTIADIEELAEEQVATGNYILSRMTNSYGWRVLKNQLEKQGIDENTIIPAPASSKIDGSSDVWAVACTYYYMAYGKRLKNNDKSERKVDADPFLKAILHRADGIIPNINEVRDLYLQTELYKKHYNQSIIPPNLKMNLNSWVENPLAMVDQYINAKEKYKEQSLVDFLSQFGFTNSNSKTRSLIRDIIKGNTKKLQKLMKYSEFDSVNDQASLKDSDADWVAQQKYNLFIQVLLLLIYETMRNKKPSRISLKYFSTPVKDCTTQIDNAKKQINRLLAELKDVKGDLFEQEYSPSPSPSPKNQR